MDGGPPPHMRLPARQSAWPGLIPERDRLGTVPLCPRPGKRLPDSALAGPTRDRFCPGRAGTDIP